jgi:hypothetical protein
MLRLIRICGCVLLVNCGTIGLLPAQVQQPRQPQSPQAAAQIQQALQQQQAIAAEGKPVPVLVVTAPVAIAAGIAEVAKVPFDPLNKEQADYLDVVL